MANRKLESEMTSVEVQGERNWPSHITTDEMRRQLRWEDELVRRYRAGEYLTILDTKTARKLAA